ncbi:RING-H2 finger protein ATL58-like [Tasmannia lanceolata]|uniref:RING-H2 finger protein ATL58-like n=1 Tax=Tasmannia lanceolata TaxID=3420 RepID=UPI00406437D4
MSYSSSDPPVCCSTTSSELKLFQVFIFSLPLFFTFSLLLLLYFFCLRRRRVDSLRMMTSYQADEVSSRPSDSGLKKELREMLPVIIFKESFSIREIQCSVCLGEYEANDRLQQIPACGHTFHMECIDLWLAANTTCPLCRVSLLPAAKPSPNSLDVREIQANETQTRERLYEGSREGALQRGDERWRGEERDNCSSEGEEIWDARREFEQCGCDEEGSVVIDIADHDSVEERL